MNLTPDQLVCVCAGVLLCLLGLGMVQLLAWLAWLCWHGREEETRPVGLDPELAYRRGQEDMRRRAATFIREGLHHGEYLAQEILSLPVKERP